MTNDTEGTERTEPEPSVYSGGERIRVRYTGSEAEVLNTYSTDDGQYLWILFTDVERKRTYPTTVMARDVTSV